MGRNRTHLSWPVLRQVTGGDPLGRGAAAMSRRTADLRPRTETADRVVGSVCPYCAVGCGQKVYVEDGRVTQIEGDPDSPVSRGRLCPKGSATLQLTTGAVPTARSPLPPARTAATGSRSTWTRRWTWSPTGSSRTRPRPGRSDVDDQPVNRTMGIASLGGATLDNEENYLIKKLFTALGVVQVENQARVCHSSTVVGARHVVRPRRRRRPACRTCSTPTAS